MSSDARPSGTPDAPRRELTLVDSTAIIVGIIIGSGLYGLAPTIAVMSASPVAYFTVWGLGGLFVLVGALCYAELATTYAEQGGDYLYLLKAFGRNVAFLFAWSQLWIVRPGNVGAMAYVFAEYAMQLFNLGKHGREFYALLAVVLLSLINLVGVRQGKWTQNALTAAKVIGIAIIFGAALFSSAAPAAAEAADRGAANLPLAMILVLFVYGGWNEMAFVAAEVRDPRRNIVRALVAGTLAVTVIYLAANVAFVHVLGFDGLRRSDAVAADVAKVTFGRAGGTAVSLLICVSALGAINGMIFTGSRVQFAVGREHRSLAWLGHWSARFGTPARAIAAQMIVTLGVLSVLYLVSRAAGTAGAVGDALTRLVNFTAPAFWCFLMLVGVALIRLRSTDAPRERPFRVPLYPASPILFALVCGWMTWSSLRFAIENRSWEGVGMLAVLATGIIVPIFDRAPRPPTAASD